MLYELVYNSSAPGRTVESAVLRDLLISSRKNNLRLGITGLLLYHNGAYIQLLEGTREAVELIYYGIIAHDRRHKAPSVCWEFPIQARNFGDWQMGFAHRPDFDPQRELQGYAIDGLGEIDLSGPGSTGRRVLLALYKQLRGT